MRVRAHKLARNLGISVLVASLLVGMGPFASPAHAAQLPLRSITVSNNQAGTANVQYNTRLFLATAGTLGSIEIQFCSNSPLIGDSCTAPAGFDISAATVLTQSGQTGFTVSSSSTANDLILTRPPAAAGIGLLRYELGNVTNPGAAGPLFARITTFATSNASGAYTDFGGIALVFLGSVSISLEVPPFLIFCIGESITNYDCTTATEPFSDLGDLNSNITGAAQHQMVVATNASNGYSLWAAGNTMTSGNNTIAAMTGAPGPSQKGIAQFGMNLRANTDPVVGQDVQGSGTAAVTANFNQPDRFYFNSGEVVATTNTSDAYRKYTVSYIVNVPKTQPGGVYSTTLTYVCLANF